MGGVSLAGPSGVLWGNPRFTRDRAWGTFPVQTLSWEAQPRWTWLLWRPRGLQDCVREDFLKCHILPDTPPLANTTLRLFFIYRLCRKQSPTEHLMRLKEAQMVCKEQCFSTEHSRKTRQNYQTIIYENVKHQKYHKEAPFWTVMVPVTIYKIQSNFH